MQLWNGETHDDNVGAMHYKYYHIHKLTITELYLNNFKSFEQQFTCKVVLFSPRVPSRSACDLVQNINNLIINVNGKTLSLLCLIRAGNSPVYQYLYNIEPTSLNSLSTSKQRRELLSETPCLLKLDNILLLAIICNLLIDIQLDV